MRLEPAGIGAVAGASLVGVHIALVRSDTAGAFGTGSRLGTSSVTGSCLDTTSASTRLGLDGDGASQGAAAEVGDRTFREPVAHVRIAGLRRAVGVQVTGRAGGRSAGRVRALPDSLRNPPEVATVEEDARVGVEFEELALLVVHHRSERHAHHRPCVKEVGDFLVDGVGVHEALGVVGDLVLPDQLGSRRRTNDLGSKALDLVEGVALAVDLDEHLRVVDLVDLGIVGPLVDVSPGELQLVGAVVDRVDVPLDVVLVEHAVTQRLPGQHPTADLGDVLERRRGARVGSGVSRSERRVSVDRDHRRGGPVRVENTKHRGLALLVAGDLGGAPDGDLGQGELVLDEAAVLGARLPRRVGVGGVRALVEKCCGVRRSRLRVGGSRRRAPCKQQSERHRRADDEGGQPLLVVVHGVEPSVHSGAVGGVVKHGCLQAPLGVV